MDEMYLIKIFVYKCKVYVIVSFVCRLLLSAAEGELVSDVEIQFAALHVICNCVCGPYKAKVL